MPVMDAEFARRFAREWVDAWNAHDLDAVLAHYAEDFCFASPIIVTIAGEPSGRLEGKTAIRAYWAQALKRVPDLHFRLLDVLAGVGSVTISYEGHRGKVAETFEFGDASGKVTKAWACYSVGD
jgi:ketosteroid isomerase-like protein